MIWKRGRAWAKNKNTFYTSKRMKKFFQYLSIIIFLLSWGMILRNNTKVKDKLQEITGINLPCSKPLEYSIGTVDPRFNIEQAKFLTLVNEAENAWESQMKKNLFAYSPEAAFKINLVFDERQVQSNEADKLSAGLTQLEASQNKISSQYDSLSASYSGALEKYNANISKYEKQLKNYNKHVDDWNGSDKTSQSEFDSLQKEKKDLGVSYDKLQKEQTDVNALAKKTNNLVAQEKSVVNEYNSNVSTYKDKYGAMQEFEKGVYQGAEIDIYQFKQATDLRMTLIHELGHSIGLGHIESSKSIMYYLMGDQDMQNPTLSAEDVMEFNRACKLN